MLYKNGAECGSYELKTADKDVELFVEEYDTEMKANGQDIVFLTVGVKDKDGNVNMQENKKISVYLEGEGILQGYGSADSAADESYKGTVCHTFDGYVQAAVRSTNREGTIRVTFSAEGCEPLIVDLRSVESIKGGI